MRPVAQPDARTAAEPLDAEARAAQPALAGQQMERGSANPRLKAPVVRAVVERRSHSVEVWPEQRERLGRRTRVARRAGAALPQGEQLLVPRAPPLLGEPGAELPELSVRPGRLAARTAWASKKALPAQPAARPTCRG